MASFVDDEGTLRILVALPGRTTGTSMYSIDASGRYLDESHTINTQLVSAMAIWKLDLNWEWHLAIANQPYVGPLMTDANARMTRKPLPDIGPMITIHSWRISYFDNYQTITLPFDGRVNKLEPVHINDQEFLVVAMESYRQDGHNSKLSKTDSMIYKLDFGEGTLTWVQYQYLGTKHAIDVSSFVITHKSSLQKEYYIAVVGQGEPSFELPNQQYRANNGASNEHGLIIYKYLGDRFVKTHSISAPEVTKIDTLSYGAGDNYVIVALMSDWTKEISLYLFDGLNLNLAPSPAMPSMRPPYPRPQPAAAGRYQRTMNSDGFRLFDIPKPVLDEGNGTMKRTLDEGAAQAMPQPALVYSNFLDSVDDIYGAEMRASSFNETRDVLYQLPITEMIAENEAKLDKPTAGSDEGHSKRSFVGMASAQDMLTWCKTKISSILADGFESSARRLATLPRVDQARPIELHGDLIVEGDLHVSNLLYSSRIEDVSIQNVIIDHVPMDFSQTFNAIQLAHSDIDRVKSRVDQILVDDGSIQEIYSPLRFEKIIFECLNQVNVNPRFRQVPFMSAMSCPQVGGVRTILLNQRDISDIQRQALLTGRSMRISQDIRFEHLVLRGRTTILDSLNSIRIDEIVSKKGQSTEAITGHKNLRSGLYASSNLLVDSWNGVRVDRETYLTSSGDQRIDADLRFNLVIIGANPTGQKVSSRIEVLNGLHLDAHLAQIARTDMPNQFELPIEFDELIIQGPTHFGANSLLSSIDIEDVWRSAMFKHMHQNVSAPMDFTGDVHVSYGGDIIVDQLINGVVLAPDNVMMRNRDYNLSNPVVFDDDLSVRHLQVHKHLNGIQVFQNYETGRTELAILYDGGNQALSGDKILYDIRLGGQSNIGGAINGHLNLTQLYNLVRNNGEPFRFGRVRIKGNDIRIADPVQLHVNSFINGIHANDICMLANRLDQSMSAGEHYNRLRFEQPVAFSSLRCASINGFNELRNSFLMKQGQQRVAGTIRLLGGVILNSTLNIRNTFNNLGVSSMANAIQQVLNESRTGHKDFYGDLYVDELIANSINDLPLSQVFVAKTDHPQVISAPMVFDHLDIENVLIIGQNLFTRSFNNLNVSDIITNTLQYDAPQVIYNHVELDHLHILPGANLVTKSINDRDLHQIYSDSVLVDVPQQILAPKTFNGHVHFTDRVFLRFGMDGLTESELKFILLLQSDELIEDDLEFDNDVTILKSLEIQTGIINDVDVNLFVDSMLSEKRKNGLRVLGNSSLRFRDVKLNNLVVTGTVQGLDLSKDALSINDNQNGTYNSDLRDKQIYLNQQGIFNNLINKQLQDFRVQTNYHNESYSGMCHIHSCPQTTPYIPLNMTPQPSALIKQPLPMIGQAIQQPQQIPKRPPLSIPYPPVPWTLQYRPGTNPLPVPDALVTQTGPPSRQERPVIYSPVLMPRPMNLLINTTQVGPVWRPQPQIQYTNLNTTTIKQPKSEFALVDPKYLEHQARLKAQAIIDLSTRVNKYLTLTFYYDIVQKHPLLGPVLHAARNPISNEEGNAWLLLKATAKKGEPCLQRGQKIDVMVEKRHKGPLPSFATSSLIQETSNPSHVESLVVGKSHYIFITDIQPEGPSETASQLLVYEWDYPSGMYNLKQRLYIDGYPTALRGVVVNQIGCIALANPRVVQSNHSGAPLLYCQQAPLSDFNSRTILPLQNIYDLDIVAPTSSNQILIAALSHQHTEQMGDLIVSKFDVNTGRLIPVATRRTARPLKLHFVKQTIVDRVLLVVSEGITSNDAAQATTRIFAIHFNRGSDGHLLEGQVIRDNQFTDIQSVLLDEKHPMIFLQSTNSISIYAPLVNKLTVRRQDESSCDPQFALIQRVPTKGANKFLAFNSNLSSKRAVSRTPLDHILVLSRDDCEHQKYSTLILKPKFR